MFKDKKYLIFNILIVTQGVPVPRPPRQQFPILGNSRGTVIINGTTVRLRERNTNNPRQSSMTSQNIRRASQILARIEERLRRYRDVTRRINGR